MGGVLGSLQIRAITGRLMKIEPTTRAWQKMALMSCCAIYAITLSMMLIAFGVAMMLSRVKITPAGRLSLPADIRKRYGLSNGGEVFVEDRGTEIVLRTSGQAVAQAQALSRKLLAGKENADLSSFLAGRRRDAEAE